MGYFFIGNWVLSKCCISKYTLLDELIFGVLVCSSILSFLYCFTRLDIGYLSILLGISSLLLNYKKVPSLIYKLTDINININFIIFYILVLYLYLWPSYENIFNVLRGGGQLFAHIDFFNHSSIIEQIKIQPNIHNTQILLFGEKVPFYHYGIYIFPSLLARLFNFSGIIVALWILFPFGILILCNGLFDFVKKLTKGSDLICALICLVILILGDTSRSIYFNNPIFDIPYLIAASPGALFGVGIIIYYLKFTLYSERFNYKLFFITLLILIEFRALYLPLFLIFCIYSFFLFYKIINFRIISFITFCLITTLIFIGNINLLEFYKFMLTFKDSSINFDLNYSNSIPIAFQVVYTALGGGILLLFIISILLFIIIVIRTVEHRLFVGSKPENI